MNAKTAASFFLSVKEEWGVGELAGLLGNGFADELRLGSPGNGLKELGVKVRERLREKWAALADAAGVRRNDDARKALILISAHLLRIPVANHALRDGTFATNPERTSS